MENVKVNLKVKKVLDLVDPPIKVYQYLAYPLSIILANKEAWPWFFSNFIQLYNHYDLEITMHNHGRCFDNYPWLSVNENEQERFNTEDDLIDWIVNLINEDRYVYLYVNEFFIEDTSAYKKREFFHDIMIHGYDIEKKIVFVSGYTKSNLFSRYSISFDSIKKGALDEAKFLHRKATMFKYKKYRYDNYTYLSYHFDLNNIINLFDEYINNKNTSIKSRMNYNPNQFLSGIIVYNIFHKLIDLAEETKKLDIRQFHCLYEHKQIMKNRIKFLEKRLNIDLNSYYNEAEELCNATLIIRNLILKYRITEKKEILINIKENITKIEEQEHRFLLKLTDELRKLNFLAGFEVVIKNNDESWLESLVNLSKEEDNYPIVYEFVANSSINDIHNAYIRDKYRTTTILKIFFNSMLERTWYPLHIKWFVQKYECMYDLIDDYELKELLLKVFRELASQNIQAAIVYNRLATQ